MMAAGMFATTAHAQLIDNPYKFLGNITTRYQMDTDGFLYRNLWNQVTPENETKWASIEGNRGSFNFGGADNAYNYAKKWNLGFKFHCLIWGAQYPSWLDNLSKEQQYTEIVKWFDAVKAHYPDLKMIDVVNEAVPGHQPARYKDALGGDGQTGYDWIIKAFEMAHERWPDAILIYNDYNTFQWQRTEFINLVKTLINAGAPIDAYGCQSHDLTDMNVSSFKSAMTEIQNALKIPMYSTEYDIGTTDDALQLQRYKEQIPVMWEADYCAGITLWGFIYGATWTTDGNSGIIRNGKDRPAMTWLREYMKSDAAKNAKSPFEKGYIKEASIYMKAAPTVISIGDSANIVINARLKTKTIQDIKVYVNGSLYTTLDGSEAVNDVFTVPYVPAKTGNYTLKAIVTATDGTTFQRPSAFTVHKQRTVFRGGATLPGVLQAENFDGGGEGFTFHDSDTKNEGVSYRSDGGGVDIVSGNGGYAIGYTNSGEWLEYTVDVQEEGYYGYKAWASSGTTNSGFSLSLADNGALTTLIEPVTVPCITQNSWDKYSVIEGKCVAKFPAGKHVLRLAITGSSCNIDRIEFTNLHLNPDLKIGIKVEPAMLTIGETATITVNNKTDIPVDHVDIFADDELLEVTGAGPYTATYTSNATGLVTIKAVAVDTNGNSSDTYSTSLIITEPRSPYLGTAWTLPGLIEAENFDAGGEGLTFHDTDYEDEGKNIYRNDNAGLDIIEDNGGYVVSNTAAGEWMEYSVNIVDPGTYTYDIVGKAVSGNPQLTIALADDGKITALTSSTNKIKISNTKAYETSHGNLLRKLKEGNHIIRVTVNSGNCCIDNIKFTCVLNTAIDEVNDNVKSDVIYDLQGRRITDGKSLIKEGALKGIYIINGKKRLLY